MIEIRDLDCIKELCTRETPQRSSEEGNRNRGLDCEQWTVGPTEMVGYHAEEEALPLKDITIYH